MARNRKFAQVPHGVVAAEKKLNRNFEVGCTNRAWVGDITSRKIVTKLRQVADIVGRYLEIQ